MNSFPVNIEDYFARVLNIKMCMRKIFYPILLLALIACKGQQQTADSESVSVPATESVNPEMGKNNGQSDADATAQPEVDAITSATSRPNQVSFNGRIVLPPQRQATVALTIGGVIKNTSLLPGQHVTKNSVIATLENPEFITLQQTYLDSHAQTEYLRMEYERQKNLSAEQAASQKKFQQSKADYLSMKSRQDAAAAQLSLLGVNPETLLRDGIQPLLEVKAPISGYVVNVAMNMGKYINPEEALCEVIDPALLLELEGQTTEAPLTHGGNGVFTGEAAVPVEGNGSLTVTLLADTGGTVTREQAEFVYQLSDLLPVTDGATGTSTPYWEEDTLLLQSGFFFCPYDRDHDYVEVRDPEFRLYRNGELILEEAAVYHPMSDDIPYCYYLREVNEDGLGQTIPVDAQPGDDLRLAFACQDQFGLAYEFTVDHWQVLKDDAVHVSLDEDFYPTLTWPE